MADKRKRRFWNDAEKIRIIAQTQVPGVSVAQVARRYDLNANLIFKWLRDPTKSALRHEREQQPFMRPEGPSTAP